MLKTKTVHTIEASGLQGRWVSSILYIEFEVLVEQLDSNGPSSIDVKILNLA